MSLYSNLIQKFLLWVTIQTLNSNTGIFPSGPIPNSKLKEKNQYKLFSFGSLPKLEKLPAGNLSLHEQYPDLIFYFAMLVKNAKSGFDSCTKAPPALSREHKTKKERFRVFFCFVLPAGIEPTSKP